MNGISKHRINDVKLFWSQLKIPHVILLNDCPDLLQQLERRKLRLDPGKGLNLWLAFGWLAANRSSGTVVVHDCDIENYSLDLPLTLALPVARLGYDYCKGYYSRVREELFGRVTRLFMIPLIRSLIRVLGHTPMLDFIDSFRYPLSGEYSMSFDTAMNLPVENGWAIELGCSANCTDSSIRKPSARLISRFSMTTSIKAWIPHSQGKVFCAWRRKSPDRF